MNTQLQTSNTTSSGGVEEKYALRPYQIDGINKITDKWRSGIRSILFQSPTATGKTILFSEIARLAFINDRKMLIVVHRRELIEQAKNKLLDKGVEAGIIMAGESPDYTKTVQIASIQTLSNREYPEAQFIIIDEAHHATAKTYRKLWEIYPNANFLGVTATPIRLSGEGFEDLFDELIISESIHEFISGGFLVPVIHYVCSTPELSKIKLRGGEYENFTLSQEMMKRNIMSELVGSYKEKCSGKSAIVFAVNVEHSKRIAYMYNRNGISAAHIDSLTPTSERQRILTDFRNKKIKVVCNVEIITEGFDFPECEVVQLARPTKSLSLYLQMIGRVMRPADGKIVGIVLDHANLLSEHGSATMDRKWSLKGVGKKSKNNRKFATQDERAVKKEYRAKLAAVNDSEWVLIIKKYPRLKQFERILQSSLIKNYRLLYSYNIYKNQLSNDKLNLTKPEFEYIQKRLNDLNSMVPVDQRFESGFWFHEAKKLGFGKPRSDRPIIKQPVSIRQLQYAAFS